MPELSDPLGAPKIVTGVDYMDALARLGYNVENMSSPLPVMSKIAQSATSLVDNQYNQALQWQKDKAGIQEAVARANNIDSVTDYNNQALDLRLKDMDLRNKQAQQTLDFASDAHPIQQKLLENQGKSSDLAIRQAQRSVDDQNEALNLVPQATSELPNPDDPDYLEKRDQWRMKYNKLLTNPATKARMEGEFQAMDGVYQGKISTQQTIAERKEVSDLQMGGFIPKVLNPDALMRSPDKDTYMTRGRMLQARQQVEMIASELPDGDPAKDRLQTILNEADTHTKSDTGVQDIMAGKSSVFDTNGRLTGTSLGAAQQAEARARALSTAGKPETQLEIGLGQPTQKGEYPSKLIIKGVTPEVGQQLANRYGLNPPQPPQPPGAADARFLSNIQDPQIRSIGERLQRKEITYDQAIKEMQAVKQPAPIRQPGMPAGADEGTIEAPSTTQTGRAGTEDRLATSNNDYKFPSGAPDVLGIDRNVWANVMSEEGAEPGLDPGTNHMSVFGLWQDKPGAEGNAFRVAIQNGPHSLEAYNAVTQTWAKWAAASKANPWELESPGMQELVLADVQHTGGSAKVRQAIDSMGGFDAINKMDPGEAIRQYSKLRLSFWRGNAERVQREGQWALANDGTLRGGKPVAQASHMNSALPRPRTVAEARALPPGTHFLDPEGNRRMVA
jgi:hypothetical protein